MRFEKGVFRVDGITAMKPAAPVLVQLLIGRPMELPTVICRIVDLGCYSVLIDGTVLGAWLSGWITGVSISTLVDLRRIQKLILSTSKPITSPIMDQ